MDIRRADRLESARAPGANGQLAPEQLPEVLHQARLQVLRWTLVICLLIACSNVVGSMTEPTTSGRAVGPATVLAVAWCLLWTLAIAIPRLAASYLARWQLAAVTLAVANTATVALTNGIQSPVLAVCMYVGWVVSVVAPRRAAVATSVAISCSVLAGYVLAGASIAEIFAGPHRYNAVTNMVLPLVTGLVGVLLATVANLIFGRLPEIVEGLRGGAPAASAGMTALLAMPPRLALPAADIGPLPPTLTAAEREVVALLADGYRPKQGSA